MWELGRKLNSDVGTDIFFFFFFLNRVEVLGEDGVSGVEMTEKHTQYTQHTEFVKGVCVSDVRL